MIICSLDDQFLEFFVYFGDQPSDAGLVKIFSYSVGCHFVLLTVSFALQKLLSFKESHLLIVSLSVCAAGVVFKKSAFAFKCTSHFLFYKVQCGWLYVEVFDPFGLEFCVW